MLVARADFVMAVVPDGRGVRYALVTERGEPVRTGSLSPGDVAGLRELTELIVAVDDYTLLTDELVRRIAAGPAQLGLLPPWSRDTGRGASALAREAADRSAALAFVRDGDLAVVAPHLEERHHVRRRMDRIRGQVLELIETQSPEYAALLAAEERFDAPILALLRRHPLPHTLRAEGPFLLSRSLAGPSRITSQRLIDGLMRLSRTATTFPGVALPGHSAQTGFIEAIVPSLADEHSLLAQRLELIDGRIYGAVSRSATGQVAHSGGRGVREAAHLTSLPANVASPQFSDWAPLSPLRGTDPAELVDIAFAGYDQRYSTPSESRAGYELYRSAHDAVAEAEEGLDELTRVELDLRGQVLAVDNGDYEAAARHSAAVRRDLESASASVRGSRGYARLRADAAIVNASTELFAVDSALGFVSLRAALGDAESASPLIEVEARGTFAMILAMWGEIAQAREALERLDACPGLDTVPAVVRAPADIARMLTSGFATLDDDLREARDRADADSSGTRYRSYFHFANMLTSYVTNEFESALASYNEIRLDAHWRPHSIRFTRMSRLSYAAILGALGQFARCRRVLSELELSVGEQLDPAEAYQRDLIAARLDIAAGDYDSVLDGTAPGGAVSESRALEVRPRYAPASLVLRGSVLWHHGEREGSAAMFARALEQAALRGEYIVLRAVETHEFREWLTGLAPGDLPDAVAPRIREAILGQRVFVDATLPVLTRQQRRVLHLLATGKSAAAIAAELSVTGNTLKTHLRQLYRRLGVKTRAQAVLLADEYGLLI